MKIENEAFDEIINQLPEIIKSQYLEIWKEYQNNSSKESLFVHQIDRLEMALQAKIYEKSSLSKKDISPFLETAKADITHPKLKELFTKIIEDK